MRRVSKPATTDDSNVSWYFLVGYKPCLVRRNFLIRSINYRPKLSWGKVMFLHVSVILFTGGVCPIACWDTHTPSPLTKGRHPPPREQTPPPRADTPPAQCMLRDTTNKRAVRILLECNLVTNYLRKTWQVNYELFPKKARSAIWEDFHKTSWNRVLKRYFKTFTQFMGNIGWEDGKCKKKLIFQEICVDTVMGNPFPIWTIILPELISMVKSTMQVFKQVY